MTSRADRYWQQYLASLPRGAEPPARYVEAFSFGFTPEDASEIADLVLAGTKTATGSILWSYEADGKPLPRSGDHWVVNDGAGQPVCILRTTDVAILPFDEVPERYAYEGGEMDRSLATWRPIYWQYLVSECRRIGREPHASAPLVMERFVVVYREAPRAGPASGAALASSAMVRIERAEGPDALAEFVALHERVYASRAAHWHASPLHLPMLLGQTPITRERELAPFVAREGGEVVARACAAIDRPYLARWKDDVGHILLFEALPAAREGARAALDAACAWLAERGMQAARNGFGLFDMPYNTDAYDVLPPSMMRQNPPEYHSLIKQAGFETEQGFVDYAAEVTPARVERWQDALEGARRQGFEIVPLRDWPAAERARELSELWNETFDNHFGWCPLAPEVVELFVAGESPALDTSVFALRDGLPVGFCFVLPDDPSHASFAPGRAQRPSEKLNMLAIGVRRPARGRGVNYAMAGHAYLELVRRGWTHVSYTLVLDDNWPSRRTGEGLGAALCGNYVAYRRELRGGGPR